MKSNDINYTEYYKGDYMSYHIPSDDELVNLIIAYNLDSNPFITSSVISEGIDKLHSDLVTAITIAKLNPKSNHEYIHYLIHFKRYVSVSYDNVNSSLRVKLDNHYKLKELHKLL